MSLYILYYILLIVVPLVLHFISYKFLDLNFRNIKTVVVKRLMIVSQFPYYLLILLSLIGYSLTVKFVLLGVYFVVNIALQYIAHYLNKNFK